MKNQYKNMQNYSMLRYATVCYDMLQYATVYLNMSQYEISWNHEAHTEVYRPIR